MSHKLHPATVRMLARADGLPETKSAPFFSVLQFLAAIFLGVVPNRSPAEDWGSYAIVPASAPALVLEATGAGTEEGAVVSLGKPAGGPNQKWTITSAGEGSYALKTESSPTLVLTAARGEARDGTRIVMEPDQGEPRQRWAITKQEGGRYSLTPLQAPGLGLDDFGGQQTAGARIDLWTMTSGDPHLLWMIRPLGGSPIAAVAEARGPVYEPPAVKPAEVRRGVLKQSSFQESALFPGTVRKVTVSVPAQYDGSRAACVYVKFDGYDARQQAEIETMMATGEMPITVGVYVSPGEVPAGVAGTMGRRNRDFEYDGMGDRNVRFLVEELLPYVAKEFELKLSTDGNDRCISGGSSGGIAAFTAAWERPEAFSRVYAGSGSFVAFRGGHEYPAMVRKFEARPIRIYLTTATHDMENCAGDWYLLDQEMDKALKFSGYDYFFRTVAGPHVAGYSATFREAMAYLWKGWPERVLAGASAPRARDLLLPGEPWQLVAEGFQDLRGVAGSASGEVFLADPARNQVSRLAPDGKIQVFLPNSGQANGLTVGADGRLYTVSSETGKVMSYEANGQGSLVVEGLRGHSILAAPEGALYVTGEGGPAEGPGSIWLIKDGRKTLAASGLKRATGLALRPDQWLLSVADGGSKWAYSFQRQADGGLIHPERFFCLHVPDDQDDAGAEAVSYAREGQMLVATRSGIQVCADDGPTQVILPLPDRSPATGVCLGGTDGDTLFATSQHRVWRRQVKIHAAGAFSPWTKVGATKL